MSIDFLGLLDEPWLSPLTFLLGLIIGSFLNVVIARLPQMLEARWRSDCREWLANTDDREAISTPPSPLTLSHPGSHCPQCGAPIRPWHNIPVISYLWLKGRCHDCQASISQRYPLVELASGILALVVMQHFGPTGPGLAVLVLTWALLVLAVIDLDTQLLPDAITQPLLWLGVLCNSLGWFTDSLSSLYGAAAGYLALWSFYQLFRLITGKEGMGYGDFKLLAALGAWTGWQALLLIIILSSLVGAVLGSLLMVLGKSTRGQPIPFGPFLAMAGWIAMLWGPSINAWYLNISGLGHPL